MKYIKTYENLLKGKSEADVKKAMSNLHPFEQVKKYYEIGSYDLANDILKKPNNLKNVISKIRDLNPYNQLVYSSEFGITSLFIEAFENEHKKQQTFATPFYNDFSKNAAKYGHLEIFKFLHEHNIISSIALVTACENNQYDIVKYILENVDDIDYKYSARIVDEAYNKGYTKLLQLLLLDDEIINNLTEKQLKRYTSEKPNLNEGLLKGKPEKEVLTNLNKMPILQQIDMCFNNRLYDLAKSIIKNNRELIINHITLTKTNIFNRLYAYSKYGLVDQFINEFETIEIDDYNIDYELLFEQMKMNLNNAVRYNYLGIVKYIIKKHKFMIDAIIDESNWLALASELGHLDIVKYLIKYYKDKEIRIAIKYAYENGFKDIVKLILVKNPRKFNKEELEKYNSIL